MDFLKHIPAALNLARIARGTRTVSLVARQEINAWCLGNPDIGKEAWADLDAVNPVPGFAVRGWSWPRARYFWLDYRDGTVRSRWSNVTGKRKSP